MQAHPRLYVSAAQLAGLKMKPAHPALKGAQAEMEEAAEKALNDAEIVYPHDTHNAHLVRARITQVRVVSLLARFFQTGEQKYRDAAMRDLRAIGDWEYWSWITWRRNDPNPLAIYDLSYGENSTTLAIAYDWLHDSLTADEKQWFVGVARKRALESFLHFTNSEEQGKHAWWYKLVGSNWNTVCAGGAGMLALAMYEELPEADTILERVERSFKPYMDSLIGSDGAWEEGIGYWNYGMRYAYMYLLSHERATGQTHPIMTVPSTRKTLYFPLDFSPNGVPCSFGDVNSFTPLPFHFAAAERLDAKELVGDMLARLDGKKWGNHTWPNAAEALLLVPRDKHKAKKAATGVAEIYTGQDWALLADRMPGPDFYVAIRGGTTEVHHGHRDLLTFHAVVKDEAMITSLGVGEYLDTTFSSRRYEIWETSPPSKNTILINGVGVAGKSRVATTPVKLPGIKGFRLDASTCFGEQRDGPVAEACVRTFLLLPKAAGVLIVDAIKLPHVGRAEARLHSFAEVAITGDRVHFTGKRQKMTAAFASNEPAKLHTAVNAPTTPGVGANMIRWCVSKLHERFVMATLLCPGKRAASVKMEMKGTLATFTISGLGKPMKVKLETV